jgi:uroporphyrinogen III methyltransferase/synthase
MALVYGAGGDARWLSQVSIAATGPGTVAELGRHGLKADFVPSRPGLEAMAVELPARAGERVLHPASAQRGPEFRDALVAREVHCDRVTVYETVPVPLPEARMAELRECHVVAFTSRSTVHALADIAGGSVLPGVALVSIGRETSEALRARFGRVDREAATATLDALAAAIEDVLRAGGRD